MYHKNNNIIIGLLKHSIKKNTFYHSEGFKIHDHNFFIYELDVSGFDEELIKKGTEELCSNSKWYKIGNERVYSAFINYPEYNVTTQKLKFQILKVNLIKFRDLVLEDKKVSNDL
ncbi:hypothetical protein [Zunongwangia sp.]|uniref:hypothetical protein n=1 Tax=Zunongwangia sp. TaxID=1965325 RepID=UPI003AA9DD61